MLTAGKQVYKQMDFLTSALVSAYRCFRAGFVWAVGLLRENLVPGFQAEGKESHTGLPYPSKGKRAENGANSLDRTVT